MINFDYTKPLSVPAAMNALNKNVSARIIAGGTNLVDLMKRGVMSPEKLIDITALPLKSIEKKGNSISIGAGALNSTVAENVLIKKHFPLLTLALQAGASPQIRNMATVGGNLMQRTRCPYFYDITLPCNKRQPSSGCSALKGYNRMHAIFGASENCIAVHPSDMCVAMAALDATVLVSSVKGNRRILFTDFHKLPGNSPEKDNNLMQGEIITAVEIPLQSNLEQRSHYTKIRDRSSYAFALVSVAAAMHLDGKTIRTIRLAMGGVAHKPWRLTVAESYLTGREATTENFRNAANIVVKEAQGYGHNNFKLKLAPNTILETLQILAAK
ncbi:MAG: xanthine dehydrogenase family protein subunit M [Ferruginibacter sp.]